MKFGFCNFTVDTLNYRQLLVYKASQAKEVFQGERVESLTFSLYKSLQGEMKAL